MIVLSHPNGNQLVWIKMWPVLRDQMRLGIAAQQNVGTGFSASISEWKLENLGL